MIRGRIIFQKPQIRYMPYKWLVGDGSAYIDTNVALKDIADYELQFYSDVSQNVGIFGARISATNDVNLGIIIANQLIVDFGNFQQNRIYWKNPKGILWTVQWTNGGSMYINDETIMSEITYTTTSELTATLFRLKGYQGYYSGKIAKLAISNQISLTPVQLLAPIPPSLDANGIRREKDECGFLDSVSGLFYGNVGSGSFTVSDS